MSAEIIAFRTGLRMEPPRLPGPTPELKALVARQRAERSPEPPFSFTGRLQVEEAVDSILALPEAQRRAVIARLIREAHRG